MASQKMATVEITCNTKRATERLNEYVGLARKKINELAILNDSLNEKRRLGLEITKQEIARQKQLETEIKELNTAQTRGIDDMKKAREVLNDLANSSIKEVNKAIRDMTKEMNGLRDVNGIRRIQQDIDKLRVSLDEKAKVSITELTGSLKNLNNISTEKLRQNLQAIRKEMEREPEDTQWARYLKNAERATQAQIAINEYGQMGKAPATGSLASEDRLRAEAERQRLVTAYQAASRSDDAAHKTWAAQALKEIQQYNSALQALTETERKDAQMKAEQKKAADALAAATKTSDAIARNQKVTIQELAEAQKYYETELKKLEGLNLSPQDQQQVDAMKAKLDAVNATLQDISRADIDKVLSDIDSQSLETLEATLKKLKEEAATFKIGDDREIKDAVSDMTALEQAITRFKDKLAGIDQLDFDHLENVPTEKLEAALKRIEEQEKSLKGTDEKLAQQMAENKTKVVNQLNRNKQATIDYANAEKVAAERGKHSVTEMQAAYDALQQKLLSLRAEEHDAIRQTRQQMRMLKSDINEVKGEVTGLTKLWKTAVRNIATYVGVFAGFNMVKSKIMEIAKDSLALSDSMAQVQKVTGLAAKEIDTLNYSLAKLDTRTTLTQLNDLAFSAGKMGLGKYGLEGVEGFVRATNQLQVALGDDLGNSVDEAITPLAKLAENLGLIQKMGVEKSMMAIGSSINELSQTTTAVGANIVDFARRIQPAAQMIGLTTDEILALGSASDAFGISSEISATSFTKFLAAYRTNTAEIERILGIAKGTLDQYFDQGRTIEGLMAIFQRMHDIGDLRYLEEAFKALGSEGSRMFTTFGAFSKNIDMFREHLATSTKAFQEATSVTREFNLVQETAQGLMERSSNIWRNAFVNPEGVDAMKQFAQAWYDVSRAMTGNKLVMGEIKFLLAGIVELVKILTYLLPSLLGGLTVLAFGRGLVGIRNALELTKLSAAGLTLSLNGLTTAWKTLSAVGKANWFGLIATALLAAIEAFGMFNKKVQEAGIYLKGFKRDLSDLNIEYGKGEMELRRYRRAIDEANVGSKQRAAAISQFNSKFKPYLSNLLTEKSTALDVAKAYQEVCKQMRAKIAMQLKEKDISEQVAPREQWTAQRREEYDALVKNTSKSQYGGEWLTGYLEDAKAGGKNWKQIAQDLNNSVFHVAQSSFDAVIKQINLGTFNELVTKTVSMGSGKKTVQSLMGPGAKQLWAAMRYVMQDLATDNTMQQVNKKWAPEEKRINDYLASQGQETEPFDTSTLPPSKEDLKAAKKAQQEAEEAIREKLKDAKQQSDAIIAKIEEWYRLQETVVTGFAADGKWTQQQAEMVNRELEAAKNEALANARLAISGRDTQTWEQTKESLRVMMFDTGEWSQELFQQMMDVSMASIRQNLSRIDKEGGQYGITTSSLKDGLDKNAAGNRRKVQELRNKTAKEVEKMLKQYDFLQQAMDAFDNRLAQLGLLTDSAVAAANRIRQATENPDEALKAGYQAPPTAEQVQQQRRQGLETAATRFIAGGGKSMAVNYNDSKELNDWLRELTNATVSMGANGMEFKFESWADAFKEDFDKWLHNTEKYKSEIQAFYLSLVQASDDYTEATKKAYEREKKLQDQRFQLAGYKTAEERTDTSLELRGKMQDAMGSGQNFWQQNGMADTMKNDPEIMRIQNRIYYRNMEYEDAKAHLDRMLALQQEELQAAKDSGASEQQLAEMQEQQRQARAGIEELTYQRQTELLTATADLAAKVSQEIASRVSTIQELSQPIADFAENAGQKLGDMMFNMQSQSMTWNQIWKNMVLALAQSTVKMGAQWLTQKIQQALFYKQMEADEATHQAIMTMIAIGGATARMEGEAAINATGLATNAATNSAEVGQEVSMATILTMLGISKGAAKIIGTLGWWGIPLIAVISSLLLGLLASALSTAGQESGGASAAVKPKIKLASGMLTYDSGNVQTVVGDDGRVYRAREQRSLPEGVSMVTEPIATRVNGQQALVGERGPEIVIGRRTTRAIQMNRPDLLRDLAMIDRGITTRKVRTFDEGNISDMASAFAGQLPATQQGQQGSEDSGQLSAEDARALTAAIGVFAQTVAAMQKNGIPSYIKKYGTGGLIDEVQSGLKFVSKYK